MREIKFRAWDGEKFYDPIIYIGKVFRDGRAFEDYIPSECDQLMQYTGLKDKNGVEIYEGDIVEVKSWHEDEEGSTLLCDSNSYMKRDIVKYHTKYPFVGFRLQEGGRVIGNIYENPELLND